MVDLQDAPPSATCIGRQMLALSFADELILGSCGSILLLDVKRLQKEGALQSYLFLGNFCTL